MTGDVSPPSQPVFSCYVTPSDAIVFSIMHPQLHTLLWAHLSGWPTIIGTAVPPSERKIVNSNITPQRVHCLCCSSKKIFWKECTYFWNIGKCKLHIPSIITYILTYYFSTPCLRKKSSFKKKTIWIELRSWKGANITLKQSLVQFSIIHIEINFCLVAMPSLWINPMLIIINTKHLL